MKKLFFSIIATIFITINIYSQIIITEINYNSPDQDDLYEYIEIFNSSDDTIDMTGYEFSKGIKHRFDSELMPPQTFLILAKDSALINDFGLNAIVWDEGGLKNKGETIILVDSIGVTVDSVSYDDEGDWVSAPDGDGPSLELCDFTKDNADGKFWKASVSSLNKTINDIETFGTPGFANSVLCNEKVTGTSLVINEIMYNDGVGKDSLEFIEIFNNSKDTINIQGYKIITKTINFTLPSYSLQPYKTIVFSSNPNLIHSYFNASSFSWGIGGLNNKADTIVLFDVANNIIDRVEYYEKGDWPDKADGQGYSLSLCDANTDNNEGVNWQASPVFAGFKYKGHEIHANPGGLNYCTYDMDTLTKIDSMGRIKNKYYNPYISGTVYGINFNSNGLQFVIKDDTNKGVWTYSHDKDFGYSLHEGDKVSLWGKMDQYKGLTQVRLDSVVLLQKDSILNQAIITNKLDETTEGELVKIKDVTLLDYTRWTNSGSGFNVKVTNSTDTFNIRIDADTDIFGKAHPVGTFDITGLGGQYDKTHPLFDGYQLLPRYIADINPYSAVGYPIKKINEVTQVDNDGKGISVGTNCELRGLVYGINLRPAGLQFTMIDELNDGIGVFSVTKKFGYTVNEGDYISIKGKIDQYKGLLQIKPDTIILISSGHQIFKAKQTTKLGEETESQLITIKNLKIKNPSEWKADGSSFNVIVTNSTNEYIMRIDNDVELSRIAAPDYTFNVTGIGNQFDDTMPFTEGYQILPRYTSDIEKTTSNNNPNISSIIIYPNPASDFLNIEAFNIEKINSIIIYSLDGKRVKSFNRTTKIDIKNLENGIYKMVIITRHNSIVKAFIKY